jgi:hypothetical protein
MLSDDPVTEPKQLARAGGRLVEVLAGVFGLEEAFGGSVGETVTLSQAAIVRVQSVDPPGSSAIRHRSGQPSG